MNRKFKNFHTLIRKCSPNLETTNLPQFAYSRTLPPRPPCPPSPPKPRYRFSGQEPLSILKFEKKSWK